MVSVLAEGAITDAGGDVVFATPYATVEAGVNKDQVQLTWPEPVKGRVQITTRVDKPV